MAQKVRHDLETKNMIDMDIEQVPQILRRT